MTDFGVNLKIIFVTNVICILILSVQAAPADPPGPADLPSPGDKPAPADPPAPADLLLPPVNSAGPTDLPSPADPPAPVDLPGPADQPAPADPPAPVDLPSPADPPAPANLPNEPSKNCSGTRPEEGYDETEIDQSQSKGVANVRVNLSDITLIWAPFKSLLAAAAILDPQFLGEQPQNGQNEEQHPLIVDQMENVTQNFSLVKPPEKEGATAPVINPLSKPVVLNRSNLRLPAVLGPFLKRRQ